MTASGPGSAGDRMLTVFAHRYLAVSAFRSAKRSQWLKTRFESLELISFDANKYPERESTDLTSIVSVSSIQYLHNFPVLKR